MRNPGDTFGKNLMRDVFELRGLAETEAEVPPGNAKRIDVWFVPDDRKIASAPIARLRLPRNSRTFWRRWRRSRRRSSYGAAR